MRESAFSASVRVGWLCRNRCLCSTRAFVRVPPSTAEQCGKHSRDQRENVIILANGALARQLAADRPIARAPPCALVLGTGPADFDWYGRPVRRLPARQAAYMDSMEALWHD